MSDLRTELADLVKDVRELVQPKKPTPPPVAPKVQAKAVEKPKQSWSLNSMAPPAQVESRFDQYLTPTSVTIPILLVLPEENPQQRLFLENVSRAITQHFAPSKVVSAIQEAQVVLAPCSLLNKNDLIPHTPYTEGKTTYIPLNNLDRYQEDRNLKQSLWTTLKRHFQNTPLSS